MRLTPPFPINRKNSQTNETGKATHAIFDVTKVIGKVESPIFATTKPTTVGTINAQIGKAIARTNTTSHAVLQTTISIVIVAVKKVTNHFNANQSLNVYCHINKNLRILRSFNVEPIACQANTTNRNGNL